MSSRSGRWTAQDKAEARRLRERPASPNPEDVISAMSKLSIREKGKRYTKAGHMNMSQWLGRVNPVSEARKDDQAALEGFAIELDVEKAKDAPSQRKRVLGAALARSKRSGSPTSKYAKEKAQQGNVLTLNPKREPLEKRVISSDFGQPDPIERRYNRESESAIMMAPLPVPEVLQGDEALRPSVLGGAVGLGRLVEKPLLHAAKKSQADALARQVQSENVQAQKALALVAQQRRDQLNRIKYGIVKPKPKPRNPLKKVSGKAKAL